MDERMADLVKRKTGLSPEEIRDIRQRIVVLWKSLTKEQRESLIPSLLLSTDFGADFQASMPWKPAYMLEKMSGSEDYDGYPYLSPVFEELDPKEVTKVPPAWRRIRHLLFGR